jgi:hypothetical protein
MNSQGRIPTLQYSHLLPPSNIDSVLSFTFVQKLTLLTGTDVFLTLIWGRDSHRSGDDQSILVICGWKLALVISLGPDQTILPQQRTS